METLLITETPDIPLIRFEPSGSFEISGRSLPENAAILFEPVFEWLRVYQEQPAAETVLDFKLEYVNSSSTLMLIKIMNLLQEIRAAGNNVTISWYYVRGDDLMEERGLEMQELLEMPINVRTY